MWDAYANWPRRAVLAPFILALWAMAAAPAAAWDQWHGDAANTGFVDTVTLPADVPVRKVSGIGPIAPGAGPVIGPDGTVYLATADGVLSAFMPGGDLKWRRSSSTGNAFRSSPAVSAQGDVVYVIGGRVVHDHRNGPAVIRNQTKLFRYNQSDGVQLSATDFPPHDPPAHYGMSTTAAPVLWRQGVTSIATENTDAVPPAHAVPRMPKAANPGLQRCRGPRVPLTCLAPLTAWQSLWNRPSGNSRYFRQPCVGALASLARQ
jgi:hypothetical protein